jgi:hypothetical protein
MNHHIGDYMKKRRLTPTQKALIQRRRERKESAEWFKIYEQEKESQRGTSPKPIPRAHSNSGKHSRKGS